MSPLSFVSIVDGDLSMEFSMGGYYRRSGVVNNNNQDHSGLSTRFLDVDRHVQMKILGENGLRSIALQILNLKSMTGGHPLTAPAFYIKREVTIGLLH